MWPESRRPRKRWLSWSISIVPRGRALGVTVFLPERDRYSLSRRRLESRVASLFGGRVAEELVFGPDGVATGAQDDIRRATQTARDMVTMWGLSATLGPLSYEEDEGEVFLGQAVRQQRQAIAEGTARRVDGEVRRIVDEAYGRARSVLTERIDALHRLARALVEHETLTHEQIAAIIDDEVSSSPPRGGEDNTPRPGATSNAASEPGGLPGLWPTRPAVLGPNG